MQEPATVYYRQADGILAARTHSGPEGAVPASMPEGAKPLSAKAYRAALDEVHAAREVHAANLRAADEERTLGDFEALRAAGIPEATARRLSGHLVAAAGKTG